MNNVKEGKSITAVPLDEFIDMLYECGWRNTCDAQHDNIKKLHNDILILKQQDYKVHLK